MAKATAAAAAAGARRCTEADGVRPQPARTRTEKAEILIKTRRKERCSLHQLPGFHAVDVVRGTIARQG
jgi:hypothetical protein